MRKRPEIPKHLQKKVARQLLERQKRAGVYEKGLVDAAKLFAAGSAYPVDVAEGFTQGVLTPPASYKAAMMRPPVPSDYKIDPKTGKPAFKGKPPAVNPEYKGTSEYVGKKLGVDVTGPGGFAPQMLSLDPMAKIHALAALGKLGAGKLAGLGLGASVFGGLKKVGKAEDAAKPIFTSPGAKATADISKETIPANKVRSQLEGRGVNKDEMEWTGFNEWIKTKKGEVSKAEIEEFFQQNQIQVREVVRGDPKSPINYDSKYAVPEVMEARRNSNGTNHDTGLWLTNDEGTYNSIMDQFPEIRAKEARGEDWEGYLVEQVFGKEPAPTKFSDPNWQLPGGENYRELLLIVPPKKVPWTKENVIPIAADEAEGGMHVESFFPGDKDKVDKFWWFKTPDGKARTPKQIRDEDGIINVSKEAALQKVLNKQPDPKPRYTGGHFEEDDVVAHIRFNERVDPDGNKVLFIEEIQGDWAHKGQEIGFKGPKDTAAKERYDWIQNRKGEIKTELIELGEVPEGNYGLGVEGQKELDEVTAQMEEWTRRNSHISRLRRESGEYQTPSGQGISAADLELIEQLKKKPEEIKAKYDPNYAKKQELIEESALLQKEAQDLTADSRWRSSRPERGPFVTDTHQWTNLALKRMIRWGSDNGFDSIAWVTGKQSADRYKASTMVDSIYWNPDSTRLVATEKGGNRLVINEHVPEDRLVDYIGKEPANRLLSSKRSPANKEKVLQQYDDGLIADYERDFMLNSHSLQGEDLDIGGEYHKLIYDQVLTAQAKKIGKKHGAKVEEGGVMTWVDDPESAGEAFGETEKVWTMRLTDKLQNASREGLPYYVALPPLVIGGAAAQQRTEAQRQQSKSDAQAILAN